MSPELHFRIFVALFHCNVLSAVMTEAAAHDQCVARAGFATFLMIWTQSRLFQLSNLAPCFVIGFQIMCLYDIQAVSLGTQPSLMPIIVASQSKA
jgi:hypothetical protein